MAKKKGSGGRRPVDPEEKKILVGFYIQTKYVNSAGGMDRAREVAKRSLEVYEGE